MSNPDFIKSISKSSLFFFFFYFFHSVFPPLSPSILFGVLSSSPPRSLLSFPLWGWFPWRWPRRPLLDPGAELANPLSERGEDGALLQEGLCRRPPPWYRWRWIAPCCRFVLILYTVCVLWYISNWKPPRAHFVFGCLPFTVTLKYFYLA